MAKIVKRDWTTDIHVRYLAFRDRDGTDHLYRRALAQQRRQRVTHFLARFRR